MKKKNSIPPSKWKLLKSNAKCWGSVMTEFLGRAWIWFTYRILVVRLFDAMMTTHLYSFHSIGVANGQTTRTHIAQCKTGANISGHKIYPLSYPNRGRQEQTIEKKHTHKIVFNFPNGYRSFLLKEYMGRRIRPRFQWGNVCVCVDLAGILCVYIFYTVSNKYMHSV